MKAYDFCKVDCQLGSSDPPTTLRKNAAVYLLVTILTVNYLEVGTLKP